MADRSGACSARSDAPVSSRARSSLETEFKTESGRAVILDFMPPADGAELVRIVVGRSGRVDFRTEYVARFDFCSTVPWISGLSDGEIRAVAGPERLFLRSSVALSGEDLKSVGDFTVEEGQSVAFVLSLAALLSRSAECDRSLWIAVRAHRNVQRGMERSVSRRWDVD